MRQDKFVFSSSVDGTGPLPAIAVYPETTAHLPLMVVQAGYAGDFENVLCSARRMAERGYFCVTFGTRGRGTVPGEHDDGGLEIMDIHDGIRVTAEKYSDKLDPTRVSIIGYSNGGGNVFFAAVRFPFLFRAAMALFGIPDYGQWAELTPVYAKEIVAAAGGTPGEVPDKYMVRKAKTAVGNLAGTRFHIAYDEEEVTCPPVMDQEFIAAARRANVDNMFVHISKPDDTHRWTHGYNTEGHLSPIEDLFMDDIEKNDARAPEMPEAGELTVLGFLVTPRFTCFLGNGDDAVASVTFKFQADKALLRFTPLTSNKNVQGKLTFPPNLFAADMNVSVDGKKVPRLGKGVKQEYSFKITSTIELNQVR